MPSNWLLSKVVPCFHAMAQDHWASNTLCLPVWSFCVSPNPCKQSYANPILTAVSSQRHNGSIPCPLVPLVERDMHHLKYFASFRGNNLFLPFKECKMGEKNWICAYWNASTRVILLIEEDKMCVSVILSPQVRIMCGKFGFTALSVFLPSHSMFAGCVTNGATSCWCDYLVFAGL